MHRTVAAFALVAALGYASTSAPSPEPAQHPEHLTYQATWNGLPVANGELRVTPDGRAGGEAVLLRGHAATTKVLDLLWRMRDSFEATVATGPPAPSRFVLRQHENSRRREISIVRDDSRTRLVGEKRRRGKAKRVSAMALHGRLHDPASLAYLIRSLPEAVTAPETYEVFTGSDIYALTVTPRGHDTVVAIGQVWPARRFHLQLRYVGSADAERAAKNKDKEAKVQEADLWVSSGPERLPLRLQGRTFWGWVSVSLVGRGAPDAARAAA
jgi:hypothetical protein